MEFFNVDITKAPYVSDFYLTLSKLSRSKQAHINKSFNELKKKQKKP